MEKKFSLWVIYTNSASDFRLRVAPEQWTCIAQNFFWVLILDIIREGEINQDALKELAIVFMNWNTFAYMFILF